MIPLLLGLFIFVVIAYVILDNKWLSIIGFTSIPFISVVIMGQIDVICVLFIFISMICVLKSFRSDRHYLLLFLGFLFLGISMEFKTYGALLFPAYCIYALAWEKQREIRVINSILVIVGCIDVFLVAMFIVWMPYPGEFTKTIIGGESMWLLRYTVLNNISIWLMGYLVIIYCLITQVMKNPGVFLRDQRYFAFFNFTIIAWFFISNLTLPQWWMLLVPALLFILDSFKTVSSYIFSALVLLLFLLYPMISTFNYENSNIISYVMASYNIPVFFLNNQSSTILLTVILGLLLLLIFDLHRAINENKA
jgi:hypothetical protein